MNKVIKKAGGVVGKRQEDMDTLYTRRTRNKLKDIMTDETHPLRPDYDNRLIERSGRFRVPKARTSRYANSFVPYSISVYNENLKRGGERENAWCE